MTQYLHNHFVVYGKISADCHPRGKAQNSLRGLIPLPRGLD
jgi:hypothetical protein